MNKFESTETIGEVHIEENVTYRKIGNITFKVVSHYSSERTYEEIVKTALLREIQRNF